MAETGVPGASMGASPSHPAAPSPVCIYLHPRCLCFAAPELRGCCNKLLNNLELKLVAGEALARLEFDGNIPIGSVGAGTGLTKCSLFQMGRKAGRVDVRLHTVKYYCSTT